MDPLGREFDLSSTQSQSVSNSFDVNGILLLLYSKQLVHYLPVDSLFRSIWINKIVVLYEHCLHAF